MATKTMRRTIRYCDLRQLLTFTNGGANGGWRTMRDAKRDVDEWYRKHGRALLPDGGIVLKPERGEKNGRIHVHAAVRSGWIPYRQVIESWTAFLKSKGYEPENSELHRFHAGDEHGKHKRSFKSAKSCAGYMGSYMTKDWDDPEWLKGQRRWESHDCEVPEPVRLCGGWMSDVPKTLYDTFGCSEDADMRGNYAKPFNRHDGTLGGYWFESKG